MLEAMEERNAVALIVHEKYRIQNTVEKYSDKFPYCLLSLTCFCPYIVREWGAAHSERADKLLKNKTLFYFFQGERLEEQDEGDCMLFAFICLGSMNYLFL